MSVLTGDSLVVLPTLSADSVASCITDPPYGLGFMGKAWDHGVPGTPYWTEVLRVLKPGGWLVAFGGTRTYHRLTCAIEDAGFEVRDCLMWLYGSGFPKGKGCLKPGWEPIVLARKPAPAPWLNVDGCRIDWAYETEAAEVNKRAGPNSRWGGRTEYSRALGTKGRNAREDITSPAGRWPANVVLDEEAAAQLDLQAGIRISGARSGMRRASKFQNTFGKFNGTALENGYAGSSGGASRFFYCPKASPSERREYNSHPTVKPLALMRWLVRLVTPPGGTALDPFCGIGTTLLAAQREGFEAIGIDSDPHAVEITRRRLADDAGPLFAERVS